MNSADSASVNYDSFDSTDDKFHSSDETFDAIAVAPGPESDEMKPQQTRSRGFVPPPRKKSMLQAAAVLVAELVGTGVLSLPFVFNSIGLPGGIVVLVVFAILSLYSGFLLHRLQNWFPSGITYGDLSFQIFGIHGQRIVFTFIYIAFFGNMAIYILTCATALFNLFYDQPTWCQWWYTIFTALFLLPFCQLRTLHYVSPAAAASGLAIFSALVIILVVSFIHIYESPEEAAAYALDHPKNKPPMLHTISPFLEVVSQISTAVFSFGGQGLYFETMAEMRDPGQFRTSVSLTTIIILFVYLLVAISCSVIYGDEVSTNILYNLPNGVPKRIASILLFLHVCVSFVLAHQVVARAIHVRTTPLHLIDTGSKKELFRWFVISLVLIVVSFIIANVIPFFNQLLGIVGALSTAPLTFGIPALLIYSGSKIMQEKRNTRVLSKWEIPSLLLLLAVTIFLTPLGVVSHIIDLVYSSIGVPFTCIHQK